MDLYPLSYQEFLCALGEERYVDVLKMFQYRMRNEYGVELYMNGLPYDHLRLITECPCKPEDLVLCTGSAILEDFRGRLLVAFGGEWSVGFLTKHNPGLELADSLSV